ncbi:MAG: MATE family efflux transporter [Spirochaetales bacterium]|nr:MATE family efflux transporter [Spirochaetales bacterium]
MAFQLRKNVDFTKGNIYKSLLVFAIPIMLGEVFQNLYHSTDSVVLGNFAGDSALAAVSVCSTLTNLLVGFCNGMSVGSTVVVAKAFGAGDKRKLDESIRYTYTFGVILGALFSVIGILIAPLLLRVVNVNDDIYSHALAYLRIYISGMVFTVVYNNSAGILRGLGDMHTPFIILLVSCSLNILLDLLFCAVFDWGIAGVAWATVLAQVLSVAISWHVIRRRMGVRCLALMDTIRNGRAVISETLDVGVAAGIQSSIISFSNLFVWRYINRFSTPVVAGVGIGQRIDKFVSLPTTSFGTAITTFVGQNLGAGNRDRVKEGIRDAMVLSIGITVAVGIIIYPGVPYIAAMFNRSPDVIEAAVSLTRIMIPLYFVNSIRQIMVGVLRAFKKSQLATAATLGGMVVMRQIYLAISMSIVSDVRLVYWGYPLGWVFSMLFTAICYFANRKRMLQIS